MCLVCLLALLVALPTQTRFHRPVLGSSLHPLLMPFRVTTCLFPFASRYSCPVLNIMQFQCQRGLCAILRVLLTSCRLIWAFHKGPHTVVRPYLLNHRFCAGFFFLYKCVVVCFCSHGVWLSVQSVCLRNVLVTLLQMMLYWPSRPHAEPVAAIATPCLLL